MKRIDLLEFASMMESFGITDPRFIGPLYSQLINADGFGGEGVEFGAAVIAGAQPKDQLMAMQAAQMTVVHWATMQIMRRSPTGENRRKQISNLRSIWPRSWREHFQRSSTRSSAIGVAASKKSRSSTCQ
jgi:hypothetical protein